MKQTNYMKYWGDHWRVKQTPKINFDLLGQDSDWEVYDVDFGEASSVAKHNDITLKVNYTGTGGVSRIYVKKGDKLVYDQRFDFLLKPTVKEIEKILNAAGVDDWKKYYTAN